jgi:glycosidase
VYVRNHGAPHTVLQGGAGAAVAAGGREGHTLVELRDDLDRIAAMGFEYVYLLPVHSPGVLNSKGGMGCPYSIRDYTSVDPELGSLGDMEQLVIAAAERGLGVVMDIVYNHTAYDSVIANDFPMCVLVAASHTPLLHPPHAHSAWHGPAAPHAENAHGPHQLSLAACHTAMQKLRIVIGMAIE